MQLGLSRTLVTVCACLMMSSSLWAKPVIHVGGYEFPPYVSIDEAQQARGFSLDLIQVLNQSQQQVTFQFVPTSVSNRHQAFTLGRYDLIMFESMLWGWQDQEVNFIPIGVEDGDLYISLRNEHKDQSYFDHFGGKKIALVSGYHYQISGWNSDPVTIRQAFDALFGHIWTLPLKAF